ncbi:hypothetical protein TH53_19975 [Pedobacter lusitanus]|uniref:DUF6443 domain-containing protein n=1 Tax=Pedobacter lusitanus TaxID=1503925 RepID=A0A0D0FSY3_9SPHI|nr:hypothetical protein [Pedobacter lusitanus]KIO75559.1 hypothetical protein TH53_19975 [Pedobacter lusitanus]
MKLRLLHFGSIFCALFLVNGFAYAQIPQDTVLDTYTGQTEITAKRRITLKSGFRIPAGKKVRIFTGAGFGTWRAIASNPSADQNYILTRVFKKPGIKDDAAAGSNGYKTSEVNQSIQYFDGLGRPLQTVTVQGQKLFISVMILPLVNTGRFLPMQLICWKNVCRQGMRKVIIH